MSKETFLKITGEFYNYLPEELLKVFVKHDLSRIQFDFFCNEFYEGHQELFNSETK